MYTDGLFRDSCHYVQPLKNDIMPVHANFSVLDAFNDIFNHRQVRDRSGFCHTENHRMLMDYYEITFAGVETIAYLLHYRPTEISEFRLRMFPNIWSESSSELFENLKKRGFVEERKMAGQDGTCFTVTDAAYDAFCANRRFGVALYADCMQVLRDASFKSIFSMKWFEKFSLSFALPANSRFKSAAEALELAALSTKDQMIFWAVAQYFLKHFSDIFKIEDGEIKMGSVMDGLGRLAKAGLVILIPSDDDGKANSEYVLSPKAAGLLFHGCEDLVKYDELGKYANIVKCRDIERKELFFTKESQNEIDNLRTMISREGFARAKRILERKKRALSIQSLLWGPPGTGKTETVKQLALDSGRDIIQFDMAKVTGCNWGATEKYYRALFRAYNYIAVISDNVPILLLNEADDILSKRLTHIDRAIDKSENTVANILLQEIENLNGIMLATTNLIDNLDSAFDRRFLFKTQLVKPDASARKKIWKSSIPEIAESEAKALADRFEMSGAQINNVVTKRDLAELYFEGDRGYAYICKLCEEELLTENGSKPSRTRIGY